jgi:hypothetical protein
MVLQSLGCRFSACLLHPGRLAAQTVARSQGEWQTQPSPGCPLPAHALHSGRLAAQVLVQSQGR